MHPIHPVGATDPLPAVVAVDGSRADLPSLEWAAEEASLARRPLLIAHAVGHLPPQMTYAERHVARRALGDAGRRIVDRAAAWISAQDPALTVDTVVRLITPAMMVPAVARDAHTLTRSAETWSHWTSHRRHGPVLVALSDAVADKDVLDYAAGYADRQGLDLVLIEGHTRSAAERLLDGSARSSLVLVAGPARDRVGPQFSWPSALDLLTRSPRPVVLVTDTRGSGPSR